MFSNGKKRTFADEARGAQGPLADSVLLAARGRLPRGEETMEYTVSMKVDGRVDVTMENYNG